MLHFDRRHLRPGSGPLSSGDCHIERGRCRSPVSRLTHPEEQPRLLTKLRRRTADMPADSAEKLAIAVAKHGSDIQEIPDAIVQPVALAAFLTRELISRVEQTRRYDAAVNLLRAAEPVFFAVVCLDWMRPRRGDSGGDVLFCPADLDKLTAVVADKIALHASRIPIISQSSEKTARLLTAWQQGHGSSPVKDHVKGVLAAEPTGSASVSPRSSPRSRAPARRSPRGATAAWWLTCGAVTPTWDGAGHGKLTAWSSRTRSASRSPRCARCGWSRPGSSTWTRRCSG